MGTSSKMLAQKLFELAKRQHGCFTAAQAVQTGYADSVHLYHVRNGRWIRVYRGVYRLATAPETPTARCMAALLWTRNKSGIIEGRLHKKMVAILRSRAMPPEDPIHVCVPKSFRRTVCQPKGLVLHESDHFSIPPGHVMGMPYQKSVSEASKTLNSHEEEAEIENNTVFDTKTKIFDENTPLNPQIRPQSEDERPKREAEKGQRPIWQVSAQDVADYYDELDYLAVQRIPKT